MYIFVQIVLAFSLVMAGYINLAFAQEVVGEIINVNYREKVAFIDVGNESLNVGDVLVVEDGSRKIYLETQEVNDAVTKLIPSHNPDYPCDDDDFKDVLVGVTAKRIFEKPVIKQDPVTPAIVQAPAVVPVPVAVTATTSNITQMPVIDPQVLTKPNLANESIQSLDTRLDKMVESNVKLFNALNELLNEKKTWEAQTAILRTDTQTAQGKLNELVVINEDLKKQLANQKFETAGAVTDREKYKAQAENLQAKVDALKQQLDRLTKTVEEQMKNVSP